MSRPPHPRHWPRLARSASPGTVLVGLVVVAAALRTWILLQPGVGFTNDLALFARWMHGVATHGLAGFYAAEAFCDYPPLFILLFGGVGKLVAALGGSEPHAYHVGTKLLASVADLATGVTIGLAGRRLLGVRAATLGAGLYLLNPVAIYDSAVWGQVDAVPALLLVGALFLTERCRWMGAGAVGALALAAKFQSVAVLPLVAFEAIRRGGGPGVARALAGGIVALAVVSAPFLATGTLDDVVRRAYVDVVGQYHQMSFNAFNLWTLTGHPEAPDTAPPRALIELAAGGRTSLPADGSWLLGITWRKVSLVLFGLAVLGVLAAYARRPGPVASFGAAGGLALAFFLFPTEMHERYAFPAIALLAPWAAARMRNERLYLALSVALLLNLVAVLPPDGLAEPIALVNLVLFGTLLLHLAVGPSLPRRPDRTTPADAPSVTRAAPPASPTITSPGPSRAIRVFQRMTVGATGLSALVALGVWVAARLVPAPPEAATSRWLADLSPISVRQGWGELAPDRAVSGAPLVLGDTLYLHGIGTHAPATLIYAVPARSVHFEALAGIDAGAGGGSAEVIVELDGFEVHRTGRLTPNSPPALIRIDLTRGRTLALRIDPTGDGNRNDHVDLVLARFVLGPDDNGGTVPGRPQETPAAE